MKKILLGFSFVVLGATTDSLKACTFSPTAINTAEYIHQDVLVGKDKNNKPIYKTEVINIGAPTPKDKAEKKLQNILEGKQKPLDKTLDVIRQQ